MNAKKKEYDDVTLEQAADALKAAAEGADEREEIVVDWDAVVPLALTDIRAKGLANHVGEHFEIELGHHDAQVTLIEVKNLGAGPDLGEQAPGGDHFEVVFRGHSKRADVPEGWYRMRHPKLGEFEIYLEPSARDFRQAQHRTPHLTASFT